MKAIIYVIQLDRTCYRLHVKYSGVVKETAVGNEIGEKEHKLHSPEDFFVGWFLWHLDNDRGFRILVRKILKSKDRPTVIEVLPSNSTVAHKSSEMSLQKIHEHVELVTMLSWFSTFGGAYSNLGDEFEKCAEMAGKISVHQMKLAFQLGDPFLISRCKLYYSIALIQRGYISQAKKIVRAEYALAKKEQETDPKLMKMCLGIWSKLIYTKQQKVKERLKGA